MCVLEALIFGNVDNWLFRSNFPSSHHEQTAFSRPDRLWFGDNANEELKMRIFDGTLIREML